MTKHSKSLPKAKPATTSATAAKKAKLVNSADGSRAKGVARCWKRLLNGHVSGGLTNTGLLMEALAVRNAARPHVSLQQHRNGRREKRRRERFSRYHRLPENFLNE